MPHKHTRKGEDKSTIDLPPSVIARPLSVSKSASSNGIFTSGASSTKRSNKKRKNNNDAADDTPRAFTRLMAFRSGKKLPKALDDGVKGPKGKKRKMVQEDDGDAVQIGEGPTGIPQAPTIKVGERMSHFAARVDAALPLSGLINKSARGGKDPVGLKVGRTKTEKRMHRMYDEWREQDRKIKEQREQAQELAEEEAMDEDGQVKWKVDIEADVRGRKNKNGKGKKRKKLLGEMDDGDNDPWAKLKSMRGEGRVSLNDVVQAPLSFTSIPKERFKVRGAVVDVNDVPRASGSLRRREELGEVRRTVVQEYRAMMQTGRLKVE